MGGRPNSTRLTVTSTSVSENPQTADLTPALVEALAQILARALVAQYQRDTNAMGESPSGDNRA